MSENFIVINTPKRTVIWSKHKLILPGTTCYLLSERRADEIIKILNSIPNLHQVTFNSEYINRYISNCSTQQRYVDYLLLQMELKNYKRKDCQLRERIHTGNSLMS